jgi:hypothetical protein
MMPLDLMMLLRKTFSSVDLNLIESNCKELTPSNRGLVGDNLPSTGSPAFAAPSSGFVGWYVRCLDRYTSQLEAAPLTEQKYREHFGLSLASLVAGDPLLVHSRFAALAPEVRETMVLEQIERLIGPSEVISDFGFFSDIQGLAAHVLTLLAAKPDLTVATAARRSLILIATRDEFMSY